MLFFLNIRWFSHFHTMKFQLQNHSLVCKFQHQLFLKYFTNRDRCIFPNSFCTILHFFKKISISATLGTQLCRIFVKTLNCLVVFSLSLHFFFIHTQVVVSSFYRSDEVDNDQQLCKDSLFSYLITECIKIS